MKAVDYSQDLDTVFAHLETSAEGLSAAEAAERLARFGANEITFRKTPAWRRLLAQFYDPMVIILLVTAGITTTLTLLGEHMLPDTLVIIGVVVLNALLGFVQEGKAEGALDALRTLLVQECLIIRAGTEHRLPARELVPGDLVALEAGDKIPADVRFVRVSNLHVDESSLTGESVPVQKITGALAGQDLVPGDQRNTGFSGTYVSQGTATAVVIATGHQTVFGQIAGMVKSAQVKITPMQRKLNEFVRSLIIAILAVGTVSFFYTLYLGFSISYGFLGAVSLVVASIPEMLPALMTSILALSGVVMARRKALIRHLPAAETLGATTVICSDKTGTLTENRMTVTRVYAGDRVYDVSTGATPLEGEFSLEAPVDVTGHPALSTLLTAGSYCNNAHLSGDGGTGDPTEIALRQSGHKGGVRLEQIRRVEEIPFDSSTKYMAVLVDTDQGRQVWVKGAPEVVLGMCDQSLDAQGQPTSLDSARVAGQATAFASNALRTLGFAMKSVSLDHADLRHEDLSGLVFVGLQGMIDPPRAAAKDAVAICKEAGIRTMMITGDHPDTARAVAHLLGIEASRAVTGAELTGMNEADLRTLVETVSVFARVAPEHKKAIAQALQANRHVVAMTGDGVNDAPALKRADVGVAMGNKGTEAAKEASEMVLADNN
ncbi:MAG: HAD-IC family P-type ATPase, partial [Saccharospirillum sp.]|uniref:cation-translocating P-type ATPase n=1 Tax=Saccharospirillum sp. TaxID=2033801 RepID=UPI00329796E1